MDKIDIIKVAKECPGMVLSIKAEDLVSANERLIDKARRDLEKEIAARNETTYWTREMVMQKFNVSPATLWRWHQRGYLVPIMVGGHHRYKSSDIDEILNNK